MKRKIMSQTYLRDVTKYRLKMYFIDGDYVLAVMGLRTVINIRSDVTITGTGTMTDPYLVN